MIRVQQLGNNIKKIVIFISFFSITTTLYSQKKGEIKEIYATSGFEKACLFSLNNDLDSASKHILKAVENGLLLEIIFIHNDLENLHQDSIRFSYLVDELFIIFQKQNPLIINPKLGFELLQIYAHDQKSRTLSKYTKVNYGVKDTVFSVIEHNKERKLRIKQVSLIIDEYGWLGYSEIGKKGGDALFLVIQHSYPEDQLLKKYLPLFIETVLANEADKVNAAKMIDRYLFWKSGVQIYGTQTICRRVQGVRECNLVRVLEEKGLNDRRQKLGLSKIEDHCQKVGYTYEYVEKQKKIKKRYCKKRFLSIIK